MAFDLVCGTSPVILAIPHAGTELPPEIAGRLNARGLELADTDWHIDRLYDGLLPQATVLKARFHRYAVDANRDPGGESLYPGQNTTGLVPVTDFDGAPIWRPSAEPDAAETARRVATLHRPYHAALEAEIARVKALHGVVVLYDCHSIRPRIPFLFEGVLPDLNIGTNGGASCGPAVKEAVLRLAAASGRSFVLNGRFKGGWTTRHYGRPAAGVHAVQVELAQSAYLTHEAAHFDYDETKAARLRPHLKTILIELERIAHDL